jgi:uncharacterized protein YecE (DUF72 family)
MPGPDPDRRILVGPAGWAYADWEGRVYPRPHPTDFHPLAWLARYVDMVEVNGTFYAPPEARHVARWVDLVADRPGFLFTAKLHQDFTHGSWTDARRQEAERFCQGLKPLVEAGRLGALLAQFPHTFRFAAHTRDRLLRLAELFPVAPLVVELRHASFFGEEPLAFLTRLGVSVAWVDMPGAAEHPPAGHATPGPVGYARLHGRNAQAWFDRQAGRDARYDWLYAPDALDAIARRVREISASGRQTFLVTNNHYGGKAVANALELKARLEGTEVVAPETLLEAFPHLSAVARSDGQLRLF